MEREYLTKVLKQDEENALNDKLKKIEKRERDQKLCKFLDNQVAEKRRKKEEEMRKNAEFMDTWN